MTSLTAIVRPAGRRIAGARSAILCAPRSISGHRHASSSAAASSSSSSTSVTSNSSDASTNPIVQQSRKLEEIRSRIFNTAYNPTKARTGAKYLRQRIVGPSMLSYYKPQLKLRNLLKPSPSSIAGGMLRDTDGFAKGGMVGAGVEVANEALAQGQQNYVKLMDPREMQRLIDVERKKLMGKGPPKKGEGRRAAMKGGSKKR